MAPKYRCKIAKEEDLKKLRANKPQELLKSYNITKFKLPFLLLHIRKELRKEINNIKPISGIIKALRKIKAAGFNLGVMTSNSKKNVQIFADLNGLNGIFDFIYSGRNLFGKEKVINKLLKIHKIKKNSAIYIGDETRDIEASKKVGIQIIAVSWGMNTKEILASLQPDTITDKPENLLKCIQEL